MKFGMNVLLWTDDPADESFLPLYERLAGMGFDGIELPIFEADPEAFARLGRRLSDMGLERTAISVCPAEADPISPDPAIRRQAQATLERKIDCCEAAGCSLFGGPLYAAIGVFSGQGPTDEERARSLEVLRSAADYAARCDIDLVLEFLNRFEIYLLNTAADTAALVREAERPNLGVHYDSFHAHIEEKDVGRALEQCAASLRHVHISESDRGTPGLGQVRWDETFAGLKRVGYEGWLTIEAFGQSLPNLAAATKIWRPLFEDEEKLAAEGLAFMRRMWSEPASL